MKIQRMFVAEGQDPFSTVEYEPFDCEIRHHKTGKITFQMKDVEVPAHWSNNAKKVVISKYFRRTGVPDATYPRHTIVPSWLQPRVPADGTTLRGEKSIREVVHRIVGHWTYTGYINNYFAPTQEQLDLNPGKTRADLSEMNARAWYDEMVYCFLHQIAAPNSPQWFNTGLWWAYGIEGKAQGHWFVDLGHDTAALDGTIEGMPNEWRQNVVSGDVRAAKSMLEHAAKQSPNAYERVQAHACFILSLKDSMLGHGGILDWYEREARIFKFGSGSGVNISPLRGENEPLSGGGKSSGSMSWMEVADRSAGSIKSGGTTRRAAKMVVMDIDHPDIQKFIDCKLHAEIATAALVTGSQIITEHCNAIMEVCAKQQVGQPNGDEANLMGSPAVLGAMRKAKSAGVPDNYILKAVKLSQQGHTSWPGDEMDNDFEGPAYQIVPFQNANNSVRIPSSFYWHVDNGLSWNLTARTSGEVATSIPATQLEEQIATAAWFSGDPGVQYDTIINDWNVTPVDGRIDASNPCSEHMRLNDSACNLASIRLGKLLDSAGRFMWTAFRHVVHLWQTMLDITNTMAHLPSRETALNVFMYRDTGLGYADLGALLMAYGLPYDSNEARALAGAITSVMQGQAHLTSSELAKELGAYPRFWANKSHHMRCVSNHIAAAFGERRFHGLKVEPMTIDRQALKRAMSADEFEQVGRYMACVWADAENAGNTYGYRNAEMTVIAPTGTISIVMDCDTTGVEPMLGLVVHKQLVGGGTMVLQNKIVDAALKRLGYDPEVAVQKIKLPSGMESVQLKISDAHRPIFDTAFEDPVTGRSIAWQAHVKMMAAVQSFISGAISKTINMPEHATIDDVKLAYRLGHDLGVKSLAIYRDGSKLSQPLTIAKLSDTTSVPNEKTATSPEPQGMSRRRLGWWRMPGIDVRVALGHGHLYLRTTRFNDGKLAEIWPVYSADQGTVQALLSTVAKTANVALQYGVPAEAIIDSWMDSNFDPAGMVGDHPYIKTCRSLMNLIARLLDFHELGNTANLNIQPTTPAEPVQPEVSPLTVAATAAAAERKKLITITGEACPSCGDANSYVFSGAGCKKCLSCGFAGGCG